MCASRTSTMTTPQTSSTHRRRTGRPPLRAVSAITPDVRVAGLSNAPPPNQFDGPAEAPLSGTLLSHLRDNIVARGDFPHDPRLVDRSGQRLFTVDVFVQL